MHFGSRIPAFSPLVAWEVVQIDVPFSMSISIWNIFAIKSNKELLVLRTIYILVLIFYITSLHFVYFVVMVGRDWAIATFVNETSETWDCRWHREILATVNVLTNLTAGGNPSVISNITYTISKTNVPTKVRSFWF